MNDVRGPARKALRAAQQVMSEAVKASLPPGTWCHYKHGRHTIEVVVVENEGGGHVLVRNPNTSKTYWIAEYGLDEVKP